MCGQDISSEMTVQKIIFLTVGRGALLVGPASSTPPWRSAKKIEIYEGCNAIAWRKKFNLFCGWQKERAQPSRGPHLCAEK